MTAPNAEDVDRCACARCPTYVEGDTKLFCLHGKSGTEIVEKGCFCRTCAVHMVQSIPSPGGILPAKPLMHRAFAAPVIGLWTLLNGFFQCLTVMCTDTISIMIDVFLVQ